MSARKTVVITGGLSVDRKEFQALLEAAGAKASGSVGRTNYLIAGDSAGSRLRVFRTETTTLNPDAREDWLSVMNGGVPRSSLISTLVMERSGSPVPFGFGRPLPLPFAAEVASQHDAEAVGVMCAAEILAAGARVQA